MSKTAIVLGATGLTGTQLIQALIEDQRYAKILAFTRRPLSMSHPKLEVQQIDLLKLEDYTSDIQGDQLFCAIGTTKAKTPDRQLYQQIDYGIPVKAAQICKANDIHTMVVVSAIGADKNSRFFYNRTKGLMEETVLAQGIKNTYLLQPSIIQGKRTEKRRAESLFLKVCKLFFSLQLGLFENYRPITAKAIATAMIHLANHPQENPRITNIQLHKIAKDHDRN